MCFLFFIDCKDLFGFSLQGVLENFLGLHLLDILYVDLEDELSAQLLREVVGGDLFGGPEESTVPVGSVNLAATCEKSECV